MPPVTPAPQPQAPAFGGFTPPASTPPAPQPGFGTNPPAFGGGGFGQPPASTPPAFGGGGFGQPPAQQPAFGQPPAEQGFGGGGFGQPQIQQPQASDVPGAFGAFGAQAFGGQPQGQPPQGGFGAPGGFGGPQQGFGGGTVGPMPPDMEWWMVLILGTVTGGLFYLFWLWKQVSFVKSIDPQSNAMKLCLFSFFSLPVGILIMILGLVMMLLTQSTAMLALMPLGWFLIIAGIPFAIIAMFSMRRSIHNHYSSVEPMGINLMNLEGALMTWFFNILFFQYHFAEIAKRKKAMGHPSV